jgi:hypothetical protein
MALWPERICVFAKSFELYGARLAWRQIARLQDRVLIVDGNCRRNPGIVRRNIDLASSADLERRVRLRPGDRLSAVGYGFSATF